MEILGVHSDRKGNISQPEDGTGLYGHVTPTSVKDIQVLTGQMAGLGRFISKLDKKGFPFFKILRKGAQFTWTEEAQETFEELKKFLANLPLLTKPIPMRH